VDVERAQRGLLRITIDRVPGRAYAAPGTFITVDDCEQVTRQLQYALEIEGLEYARLEVSSPGLDRPLKTEADLHRFSGQAIHITLKVAFQGRKVWQGVLTPAAALPPAAEPGAMLPASEAGSAGAPWNLVFMQGKAEQVLGFRFDEVREARLVPVVDFKGRRTGADAPSPEQADDQADSVSIAADESGDEGG
jgi:ribosome maturation factor RimP